MLSQPVGKLSDSLSEQYELAVPLSSLAASAAQDEPNGNPPAVTNTQEHILTVRVYDRYENVTAAKTIVR